jgi:hypothetical protein
MTVDENPAPPRANEDEPPHDDTANTTPEDETALTRRLRTTATASLFPEEPYDPLTALKASEVTLDRARARARECRETVQTSRGVFSKALAAWNLTLPVQTQEQALRDYVNTNQAERARKAAVGQGVQYPGITRTAKALGGGRGPNPAAYRRGITGNVRAYTRADGQRIEADRLRAAAAAAKPRKTS